MAGHVRQLRYAVERALLLSLAAQSSEICFEEDKPNLRHTTAPAPTPAEVIQEALRTSQGRIQGRDGAAALLGIHPATLRNRMKSLGILLPRQQKKVGIIR